MIATIIRSARLAGAVNHLIAGTTYAGPAYFHASPVPYLEPTDIQVIQSMLAARCAGPRTWVVLRS